MTEIFFQELSKVLHDVLDEHRKRQDERLGIVLRLCIVVFMSRCAMSCRVVCFVALRCAMLPYLVLCCVALRCVALRCVVLCCVVLCCVVLCVASRRVVSRCVVLCCIVSLCFVSHCGVSCRVVFLFTTVFAISAIHSNV